MKRNGRSILLISLFLMVIINQTILAEQIIRYERLKEPELFEVYAIAGGDYNIENNEIFGKAGLQIDYHFSNMAMISLEGVGISNNFKDFAFDVSSCLCIKFGTPDFMPYAGLGIGIDIPTSRDLSTQLSANMVMGLLFEDLIKIIIKYKTPIDDFFKVNTIGLAIGLQL